jgi:hypothetical protein
MRTKTLLLSAVALAAGLLTSQAQSNVYSANVVGYYKVTIPAGKFAAIASQLPGNGSDSQINSALTNGVVDGSSLLIWNGSGFETFTYFADFAIWADQDGNPATASLNPGKAAFLLNAGGSTATVTVVGQVPQGLRTNGVRVGFDFYSIPTSLKTNIDSALGVFPAADGDSYLHWNKNSQTYDQTFTYFADFSTWADQDGNPVNPTPDVGEGFFYLHGGVSNNWIFNFTVQ